MYRHQFILICFLVFSLVSSTSYGQTTEDLKEMYERALVKSTPEQAVNLYEEIIELGIQMGPTAFDNVEAAQKRLPSAYYNLGADYFNNNKFEMTIQHFEKALELAVEFEDNITESKILDQLPKIYFLVGSEKNAKGEHEEAIRLCNRALELHPYYAKIFYLKGSVLDDMGFPDSMMVNMHKAKEIAEIEDDQQTLKSIHNSMASYYLRNAEVANKEKRHDDAIEYGNKGLEFVTTSKLNESLLHFEIGYAYKKKGDKSSACTYYRKSAYGVLYEAAMFEVNEVLKCGL